MQLLLGSAGLANLRDSSQLNGRNWDRAVVYQRFVERPYLSGADILR